MRLTIELDDELLAKAREYAGIQDISELLHAVLEALVQREVSRRRDPQ